MENQILFCNVFIFTNGGGVSHSKIWDAPPAGPIIYFQFSGMRDFFVRNNFKWSAYDSPPPPPHVGETGNWTGFCHLGEYPEVHNENISRAF